MRSDSWGKKLKEVREKAMRASGGRVFRPREQKVQRP